MNERFDITDAFEKNAMGKKICDSVSIVSGIDGLRLDNERALTDTVETAVSPLIQKMMESTLGDESETKVKKALAATAALCKQKGVLPPAFKNASPDEIASIVDKSVVVAKTAYMVGSGRMMSDDAMEAIIDHSTAVLTASVEQAIDKVTEYVLENSDTLVDRGLEFAARYAEAAAAAFPLTRPVAHFIRPIVERLKPIVKPYVKKGISALAQAVKPIVSRGIQAVSDTIKNTGRKIATLLT